MFYLCGPLERGWTPQSPDVSDLLSGPLGRCILQSVCRNVFNRLKRFLLGKSCCFLIGLPLLSGSATRLPSAASRSRLSRANLKLFPYCLISISGFEERTEAHWHEALPLFEQSTRSPRPLNISLNACQNRPVDYHFNPALHMSLMLSCEIHRITISNRQEQTFASYNRGVVCSGNGGISLGTEQTCWSLLCFPMVGT